MSMDEKELARSLCMKLCNRCHKNDWDWTYPDCPAAQESMSLIKANCWLKGEQKEPNIEHLPKINAPAESPFVLGQRRMITRVLKAGFKPCKEWSK